MPSNPNNTRKKVRKWVMHNVLSLVNQSGAQTRGASPMLPTSPALPSPCQPGSSGGLVRLLRDPGPGGPLPSPPDSCGFSGTFFPLGLPALLLLATWHLWPQFGHFMLKTYLKDWGEGGQPEPTDSQGRQTATVSDRNEAVLVCLKGGSKISPIASAPVVLDL